MMKETITPEMIDTVQKIFKQTQFDGQRLTLDIFDNDEMVPCSLTQAFFPEIIDMALEHLKRKASYSLVEWIDEKPKTCNVEYVKVDGKHVDRLKNRLLPVFDWSLAK